MIGFVHHFQCTQVQKILVTVESKSSNVKLHMLDVDMALTEIVKITKKSLTIENIFTTYQRR